MTPVEALRVRQERRVEQYGAPWPTGHAIEQDAAEAA